MIEFTGIVRASLTAFVAGGINAISGGGTLLTFPVLIGLGEPSVIANATSTVGLWPGVIGSLWGYRHDLKDLGRWPFIILIPSVVGGVIGAILLLHTPNSLFDKIAPFLVLLATTLFMSHSAISRALRTNRAATDENADPPTGAGRLLPFMFFQFLVALYGGYFGAGIGILMLAALGMMGFSNIHRMNGFKSWGGFCVNGVAIATFVIGGKVDWPVALPMALGGIAGGYTGARLARFVGPAVVRRIIITVGLLATASLLWKVYAAPRSEDGSTSGRRHLTPVRGRIYNSPGSPSEPASSRP